MDLDRTVCYRALSTRDSRFDGRFFTAVRSTRIFCRPVCPARTPKPENCLFVPTAASARALGYRPCLRCRPESAPGTPGWLGTSAVVTRALRLIDEGELDRHGVPEFAARLGIGERHLRRLFDRHLGATPLAVARTRRVLFAKKLIDETALPMVQVALASGFPSVRRFNEAIRETYARTPRDLRRSSANVSQGAGLSLRLPYRAPLDWKGLLEFLGPRSVPGVESVHGGVYRRTVRLGPSRGWIEVEALDDSPQIDLRLHVDDPAMLMPIVERVRRVLDLGADPHAISEHLRQDPDLGPIVSRRPGARVPGAWDSFELAVRAVLGQQISVAGATTLAGRLVASCGEALDLERTNPPDGLRSFFPGAAALATADLGRIGLTGKRAATLANLAAEVRDGTLVLDSTNDLDTTIRRLVAIPGIGEWTAQYIAMRALGEPDAFPAGDLWLRRALAGSSEGPLSVSELEKRSRAWSPWRAYAAIHLWSRAASAPSTRRRNHVGQD